MVIGPNNVIPLSLATGPHHEEDSQRKTIEPQFHMTQLRGLNPLLCKQL